MMFKGTEPHLRTGEAPSGSCISCTQELDDDVDLTILRRPAHIRERTGTEVASVQDLIKLMISNEASWGLGLTMKIGRVIRKEQVSRRQRSGNWAGDSN